MRSIQSTLFTLLIASSATYAESRLNLTPGVSPISHDVFTLHMIIFWICVVIGILVFGVMIYAMIYHRKSRGAKPAEFHSHPVLEVTWTIIPVIILILMAIPATKVLLNMNNEDKEALTIKITGYQWKWNYEYLEDNITFFSNLLTPYDQIHNQAPKSVDYLREVDHPLVVPIHKKIRFLITSNDVNHAWWVPDLAVKRDAISGFINEAWTIIDKPGTYTGQCAELCGVNHAFMPIVVVALSEQGYKDWVAKQKGQASESDAEVNKEWTMKELMDKGQEVYSKICAACHQPNGQGLPPTFPALKGSKVATGPIEKHIETVMNGVSGTAMQAFKNQLSPAEIAGVITYERNSFGNSDGKALQPIQIKAYHDGKSMSEAMAAKPGQPGTVNAAPSKSVSPQNQVSAPESQAPATSPQTQPAATTSSSAPSTNTTETQAQSTTASGDDLKAAIARGEKIYLQTCVACHQVTGEGMPPTFPSLKDSQIVKGPVADHIDRVMNGKQGTAMMPFKNQLKDQEIADVITYERNAFGQKQDLVTEKDIATAAQNQNQNNTQEGAKQ